MENMLNDMLREKKTNLFISEGVHSVTSFRPAFESFHNFVFYISQHHHPVVHIEPVVDLIIDDPDAISDKDRVQYIDDSRHKLRFFQVQVFNPSFEKACTWNIN